MILLTKKDYYDSLDQLFNDPIKFEILNEDPRLRNLSTIKRYLNTLELRGEMTKEENKKIRLKFAQRGRAHRLSKIDKQLFKLPYFQAIVDTTNAPHYGVSKFLTNLLNPLTQNGYTVKDSFEGAKMIHKIPPELFDGGYQYFSFGVTSIFTNVPLNKTINIILERIYKENLANAKLRKNALKKLIKGCCTKTAFSFNGIICKQKDEVSMGSSFGSVIANIITTELERAIVEPLIRSGKIKFYIRYVDDTMLLAKEEGIMFEMISRDRSL